MPRIHAPELEDARWFPALFRDSMTDYLGFVGTLSERPYVAFVSRLARALESTASREIVDLGSGGGGPLLLLLRMLARHGCDVTAKLTDLYPNADRFARIAAASGGSVTPVLTPVDATSVPPELAGFRLMCSSFHHMRPEVARAVLADAVASRRGIAVLEVIERSPASFFAILLSPLNVLLVTPFIRPFRWSRLLFTYVIPLLPLFVLWDGLMSILRIYSPEELEELVRGIPCNDYEWDIGAVSPGVPGAPRVVYLIGAPV
jgi:SAM-dependent methyltransferase